MYLFFTTSVTLYPSPAFFAEPFSYDEHYVMIASGIFCGDLMDFFEFFVASISSSSGEGNGDSSLILSFIEYSWIASGILRV